MFSAMNCAPHRRCRHLVLALAVVAIAGCQGVQLGRNADGPWDENPRDPPGQINRQSMPALVPGIGRDTDYDAPPWIQRVAPGARPPGKPLPSGKPLPGATVH